MHDNNRVIIKNSKLEVEIACGIGGSISRFGFWQTLNNKKEFFPILRSGPSIANPQNPLAASDMSCHAGIPFLNRIEPCLYQGKIIGERTNHPTVKHNIHGDTWQKPWELVSKNNNSVILKYLHNTEKGFPFKYKAMQSFMLSNVGLLIATEIINLETFPIPVGCGLHFYWHRTEKMVIKANNNVLQFDVMTDQPDAKERPTPDFSNCSNGKLVKDMQGLDANFTNPDARFAISYPEYNKKISVMTTGDNQKNFLTICVPNWTHALCAEPLTHAIYGTSNVVKGIKSLEETGIMMLNSNQSFKSKTQILVSL